MPVLPVLRPASVELAGSKLPRDTRIAVVPGIEVVNVMPPGCGFHYIPIDYRNVMERGRSRAARKPPTRQSRPGSYRSCRALRL